MPHWSCSSIAFAGMTSYDLLFIAHRDSSWWITLLPRIRGGFFRRIRIQNLDNMECSWLCKTDLNNLSVILHIQYLHTVNQKSNVLLNVEDETERASLLILLWSIQVLYIMHHILLSSQTILSLARFSLQTHIEKTHPRFNKESLWGMMSEFHNYYLSPFLL